MLSRCVLVSLAIFLFPWNAQAQVESVQVTVAAANVREGPSTDDTVIAILHEGDIRPIHDDVRIIEEQPPVDPDPLRRPPYWYEIVLLDGRHGFIAKRITTGLVGTTRGTAWEVHPITRIEVLIDNTWTEIP